MSIPQEAGSTARSTIEALRGNPLCLSLIVLIAIVGGLAFARMSKEMESDERTMTSLIDHCMGPAKR